jgi:hypothetical protein
MGNATARAALAIAVGATLSLAGCGPSPSVAREREMVAQCEAWLQAKLVAPSTYKQIRVTVGIPDEKTQRQDVFVTYDAANSFGTPIRGLEHCQFPYGAEEAKVRPLTPSERNVMAESRKEEAPLSSLDVSPSEPGCCMPLAPATPESDAPQR